MLEILIGFVLGIVVTTAAPLLKNLIVQILTGAYAKAKKEVTRWFE